MPVRLNPILPATPDAILVGDPRRAFALGQALTVQPEMSHIARGLWGYRGVSEAGLDLTVQATGVGGPSAVAVISDLAGMGVTRMIRLGTCSAVGPDAAGEEIRPGRAFLVSEAFCGDGASRALAGGELVVSPDPALFAALGELAEPAAVASQDLVLRMEVLARRSHGSEAGRSHRPEGDDGHRQDGVSCRSAGLSEVAPLRDLQSAATLAACGALGIESAALLLVAEDSSGNRMEEAELEDLFKPLGLAITRVLESISKP